MRWILATLVAAGAAQADAVDDVAAAALRSFAAMPVVKHVETIAGRCGADMTVNAQVVYCTTRNEILITPAASTLPQAPYLVAHAFGHAVQVRHGVADFALSQIRNRRSEEQMLRGLVARQVDCIAGFLVARAGIPPVSLQDWMAEEPFAGTHWGRDPLHLGPSVSVGLTARDAWFQRGQGGDLAQCAPGEFTADLLLDALNG
ncbi:hypothetical protein [Loktanella sp. Alg231-35]|uniref:hypothetical protein n=1 Tax=Loktanella sp. Alg231-35 TaxID=1922220 RepID=UPI00131EE879|nr:hypothetical protein [Loktanella sp. Alg231-35]